MRYFLFFTFFILFSCNEKKKNNIISKHNFSTTFSIQKSQENVFLLPLIEKWNDSIFKLPYKLKNNEISVIIGIGYGWYAYDERNHYIFQNDSVIKHFKEKIPKTYLKKGYEKYSLEEFEVTTDLKRKLIKNINSSNFLSFLKYNQEDFKLKATTINPCMVSDANGYTITVIQNDKFKNFRYYAPRHILEKCKHESINKKMLKDFINLLEQWNIEI